jgi:hypothetical protein
MGNNYIPDESICKGGWCHSPDWVCLAVGIVMDESEYHSGWQRGHGHEIADRLIALPIPSPQCRSVMYARDIRRVVSTDYVIVACCERVGSFLV